ncbi:hypothetical protein ABZP36_017071 [Zizania latifolia]
MVGMSGRWFGDFWVRLGVRIGSGKGGLVDPFAEANADDSSVGTGTKDYVHVRIQQRNGRKSLTTVQGLKKEYSYNKILKDLKKEFCCNGTVVQDPELGQVIQLQGDQRKNVATFLVQPPAQESITEPHLRFSSILPSSGFDKNKPNFVQIDMHTPCSDQHYELEMPVPACRHTRFC